MKNNISSDKMKAAKKAYGLQASDMDLICGFETGLWNGYEEDLPPSPSDAHLIMFATTPVWMMEMMSRCSYSIIESISGWKKAYDKVGEMVREIDQKGEELKLFLNKTYFE